MISFFFLYSLIHLLTLDLPIFRSAVSDGISPGIDSSIQSVSSQMGRRELAAFTKFAREIRPQSKSLFFFFVKGTVILLYFMINVVLIKGFTHNGGFSFSVILENPGIAFTQVAALLAEKWQSLSTEERDRYEEIARETATTRKVRGVSFILSDSLYCI